MQTTTYVEVATPHLYTESSQPASGGRTGHKGWDRDDSSWALGVSLEDVT